MKLTLLDGLTKSEAETAVRTIIREESKLRSLGGTGNYQNVKFIESYRRGYTIDSRNDVVRYKVIAETISLDRE